MFADNRVVNLFPTPVWAHALSPQDAETVNRKALDALRSLGAAPDSVWQSEPTLHRLPEFLVLTGFVKEAAQNVLGHLQAEADSVGIEALWATSVPRGTAPPAPASESPGDASLCGLYTVAAPEGGDAITFFDVRPELNLGGARLQEPGRYTARNATVSVSAGTLHVFPAWLGHAISAAPAESDRVIIGFTVSLT